MSMTCTVGNNRYRSLDFWRGIACLLVAVYHAALYALESPRPSDPAAAEKIAFWLLERGWYGVPIFFVISGYCITAACEALRDRPNPAGRYFYRRLRRIFPPYWAAVALTLVIVAGALAAGQIGMFTDPIGPVLRHPLSLSPFQWMSNLTLTEGIRHNLAGAPGGITSGFFLMPAWTLAYEEQFYAVCGLALLLSPRRFFTVLAAVTAAVACVFLFGALGAPLPVTGFFFDGRWLVFAAGVIVYYRVNHMSGRRGWRIDAALLLALIVTSLLIRRHHWHISLELRVGLAFALVLIALHRWDVAIATSRLLRPIALCGVMCYSLYLVHWPIEKVISHLLFEGGLTGIGATFAVTVPVGLGASVLAAWAFHILIERHFLNRPPAAAEAAAEADADAASAPTLPRRRVLLSRDLPRSTPSFAEVIMRRVVVVSCVGVVAFLSVCIFTHENWHHGRGPHHQGKQVVIEGELVDAGCFVTGREGESGHKECAQQCLLSGAPAAILPVNSTSAHDMSYLLANAAALAQFAGQPVRVEGRRYDGLHAIDPQTVYIKDGSGWKQVWTRRDAPEARDTTGQRVG